MLDIHRTRDVIDASTFLCFVCLCEPLLRLQDVRMSCSPASLFYTCLAQDPQFIPNLKCRPMVRSSEMPRWLAVFLETQRIPTGSRLSAWFRGESVMGQTQKDEKDPACRHDLPITAETTRYLVETAHPHAYDRISTPRGETLQSPINFSRPLASDGRSNLSAEYVHPAFASPFALEKPPKKHKKSTQARNRPKHAKLSRRGWFHDQDPRIQCKSIGTFVSGTLLVIVLTTCTSIFLCL